MLNIHILRESMRYMIYIAFATIFFVTNPVWSNFPTDSQHVDACVLEVIEKYFTHVPRDQIEIVPLMGGHSNTTLKVSTKTSDYALRIKDKDTSHHNLERELYAMEEGMRL